MQPFLLTLHAHAKEVKAAAFLLLAIAAMIAVLPVGTKNSGIKIAGGIGVLGLVLFIVAALAA